MENTLTKIEPMPPEIFSGTITVTNKDSGDYRTFLIKKEQPEDAKFLPGCRIVGLLTGPDNYYDFESFGHIGPQGRVIVWKKHRGDGNKSSAHDWFAEMINVLVAELEPTLGKSFDEYEVMQEKVCYRCGRKLTTPDSIRLGIGAICLEKLGLN